MPNRNDWFTTWDDSEVGGKSFLLEVALEGLSNPSIRHDTVNSYVRIQRSSNGVAGPWKDVGRTSVIFDENDAHFPEGFRIFYEKATDLAREMLRARVFHKHESSLQSDDLIGEADVSFNELLRAFGVRLMVDLLHPQKEKGVGEKGCGRIWFFGEALPAKSPRGGKNRFEFKIKLQTPPSDSFQEGAVVIGAPRLFLIMSRERTVDSSWSVVHRTGYVKKGSTFVSRKIHERLRSYAIVPKFTVEQRHLVLGQDISRQIRIQVIVKGRKDEHSVVGTSIFTVDDLINDLCSDTCVDLTRDGEIIGEVAVIDRQEARASSRGTDTAYTYDVEINFSGDRKDAERLRKVQKHNRMKVHTEVDTFL
jgi:C2 domain